LLTISVIIPTKDRPNLFKRAVESIYKQTILPSEIIVIDDASKIAYESTLNELRNNKPDKINFKYIKNLKKIGAAAARNIGAKLSNCDILMFLDDDDYWGPVKIENQIKVFENDNDLGMVYSAKIAIDQNKNYLYTIRSKVNSQHFEDRGFFKNFYRSTY